jgi:hypothetical protein
MCVHAYRIYNKIHLDPESGTQGSASGSRYRPVVCMLVMCIISISH